MERRKFIKIMAASSAMMAANPFALVSPRPPIIEGGKYRITFAHGGHVADEGMWTEFDEIPGIELLNSFGIPDPEDPEYDQWDCCDIILNDKAALRHWIASQMELIIGEWKDCDSYTDPEKWKDGKTPDTPFNLGGDDYYDWIPFVIRNLMISCGVINDRKLWDWFSNHPVIVRQYPHDEDERNGLDHRDLYWNWDNLWVDSKMWGPASIKKIG